MDELRAALDGLIRSVEGRCSDPRCPSQHEGAGPDCLDAAVARARAALAKESHSAQTPDPATCGWDTRRGDGPIGGPCRLAAGHDGPHDAKTPDPATGLDGGALQTAIENAPDEAVARALYRGDATPATGPDEAFEAYAERGRNPNSKASANPLRDAFMAGWSSALDMGRLADALKATYRSQYRERDAEHVVRALATPATGPDEFTVDMPSLAKALEAEFGHLIPGEADDNDWFLAATGLVEHYARIRREYLARVDAALAREARND